MSINHVNDLRRKGHWQAALDAALDNLHFMDTEWTQMSLFWVIYDMCKMALVTDGGGEVAAKCFVCMKYLLRTMIDEEGIGRKCYDNLLLKHMPHAAAVDYAERISKTQPTKAMSIVHAMECTPQNVHPVYHAAYGWVICRYLRRQGFKVSDGRVCGLLREYMQLHNPRPSTLHSMILDFVLDYAYGHASFRFNEFFAQWGAENLRYEDHFAPVICRVNKPSIMARLLRIVERSGDKVALQSLLDGLYDWCVY